MKNPNLNISGVGVASIARNTGYLLGTNILNRVVRLLYVIALAHYLGPELYGIFNYAMSWYLSFLPLTALGIGVILSREIGRNRNSGAQMVPQTLILRISIMIIAAVACGISGWFVEGEREARILLFVFSVALMGRSLAIWTENVFNAYEANQYTFRLQGIFRTCEAVVGIALLIVGGGVIAVAIVHAISWWLQSLGGLALSHRKLVAIKLNWSWQDMKKIFAQGLPIGVGLIMIGWFQSGPLVMFRHMSGSEDHLGQLALALQAFLILGTIPMAAGAAAFPVISRSTARHDGKDLLYIRTEIRVAFIFGAAAGLAGLGAGPWFVELLFGPRYMEAGYLLGLVMWLVIPFSCGTTIIRLCFARGELFFPLLVSMAGALVMSLIMPWCITAMGTSGAVLATAVGMAVWAFCLIFSLGRSGDLEVGETVFRPLAVVVFALGVFFALKAVNSWLALLTSWVALFCATLQFGGITEYEMFLLRRLKRKGYSLIGADSWKSGS